MVGKSPGRIYLGSKRGRMERREFFSKKLKLIGWLCVAVAFAAGGFYEVRVGDGPEQAGGWLCLVVCALGGVVLLKELLSSGPKMVLSGEGLFDRSLGTPVIPWQSILEVDISHVKKSGYITVRLADEAQRVANLPIQKRAMAAWNKKLGGDVFNTSISTLDVPPEGVVSEVVKQWHYYAPKR
ncbi:STM3941 family protein [Granulicella tundricola]|uniref:Uncharacterized protein n=1 Tax=Granulicella tundricola (strain ATCC BAA-1859 / DSM 23138 / MP5ACTX9) TaxID=1198114 RepID=E8X1I5_GRATM|nr:STM3941 family protein [Granulicella tundricola]ADW70220.1 hypothetical protein AciX9_3209 [Granulicella tundricola MP5ACTX9]